MLKIKNKETGEVVTFTEKGFFSEDGSQREIIMPEELANDWEDVTDETKLDE